MIKLIKTNSDSSIEIHFLVGGDRCDAYVPNNLSQPEYENIEKLLETYSASALQAFFTTAGVTDFKSSKIKYPTKQHETEIFVRVYPSWRLLRENLYEGIKRMGWQFIDSEIQVYDIRFREVNPEKNEWNINLVIARFTR